MRPVLRILTTVAAAMSLAVAACSSSGASTPPTAAVATAPPAVVAASAASPTAIAASTASTIRYDVVANGTSADYRVREQLVRLTAPSDAIGKTSAVTGTLVFGADGKVNPDQSKFVVDLTSLQSDSSMRDGFIGRGTLDLASFPTAVFVPTAFQGLPSSLPTSGTQSFQMVGNLTLHGATHPATWTVSGVVNGGDVTGTATTAFKFEDFGMTPPKAGAVLSVVDNVMLELNFHLAKSA
jgi:polyisoprenoid-binding protein YceI